METDFGIERPRIVKLTGVNYRPWSLQVKRLLQSMELWTVVELGALVATATPATRSKDTVATGSQESGGPDKGNRTGLQDAKAATIIMAACSQPVLQHILLLETAKQQWDTLKELFLPVGAQQLSTKLQAFAGYRAPEGTTVAEIAIALTTLQYEIGSIDPKEKPSNSMKIGLLFQALRGLHPLYGPLILQLELSGANKEWEAVVAHVTEFERQIKLSGGTTAVETALKAIGKPKGQGSRPFKGYCNNCGRFGHRQSECPEDSDSGDSDSAEDSKDLGSGSAESTERSVLENDQGPQEAPVKPVKPRQPIEQVGLATSAW
jgi:hypothetical protein